MRTIKIKAWDEKEKRWFDMNLRVISDENGLLDGITSNEDREAALIQRIIYKETKLIVDDLFETLNRILKP